MPEFDDMPAARRSPNAQTMSLQSIVEWLVLGAILVVLAIRTTYGESPHTESVDSWQRLTNAGFSVLLSGALFLSVVIGFLASLSHRGCVLRRFGLGVGLAVFLAGAVLACIIASDKRSAITDALTLAIPMLAAALLVCLLSTTTRVRFVLAFVAALGLVNALQSAQQAFAGNQMVIEQYEENPQAFLEPLGIEQGSLQAMLYEHRLYARDVRGFFTTGNSAGSFLILSIAALLALWFSCRHREQRMARAWVYAVFALCLVRLIAGLILVHSKGATIAIAAGVIMFLIGVRLGPWVRGHRREVVIGALLLAIALVTAIALYGRRHGTLPGGRSMLVRWEYWTAAAEMVRDHATTGVGGGNFRHMYPRYKPDAAIETVHDPHNFPLSILAQYGPLGLLGVILAMALPAWKAAAPRRDDSPPKPRGPDHSNGLRPAAGALGIAVIVLFARPLFLEGQATRQAEVQSVAVLYLYVVPVVVLVTGVAILLLPFGRCAVVAAGALVAVELIESVLFETGQLTGPTVLVSILSLYAVPLIVLGIFRWRQGDRHSRAAERAGPAASVFPTLSCWVLWCGLAAVLLANMVDFALFEPGIFTTFWVLLACAATMGPKPSAVPRSTALLGNRVRLVVACLLVVATIGVMYIAVILPVWAGCLRQRALTSKWYAGLDTTRNRENDRLRLGQMNQGIHSLLSRAASVDPLDPTPLRDRAKLYLWQYEQTQDALLLAPAAKWLHGALRRNPASFKDDVLLARAYRLLADTDGHPDEYYELAIKHATSAAAKYPGSAALHMDLAELAETRGRKRLALEHYERAVSIERAFQEHFRRMYPDREVVSRLGSERYRQAQNKVKKLQDDAIGVPDAVRP